MSGKLVCLVALLVAGFSGCSAGDNPLVGLSRLPKVHHSWPMPLHMIDPTNDVFVDYARITGSVGLQLVEGPNATLISNVVEVCMAQNCSIALNYSPWYKYFPKTVNATYDGPEVQEEVNYLNFALGNFTDALTAANERLNATVAVGIVLIDSERFDTIKNASEYNAAVTVKHETIFNITRSHLPDVRIEFYNRGAILDSNSAYGYTEVPLFTLDASFKAEVGFSISLYSIPEIGYMRESYRRTVALANSTGARTVMPWLALGCGYRRTIASGGERSWDFEWDYDEVYSWMLGLEINNGWYWLEPLRFAPWNYADVVAFYPSVFDQRSAPSGSTTAMIKHFVAYVQGATNGTSTEESPSRTWSAPSVNTVPFH